MSRKISEGKMLRALLCIPIVAGAALACTAAAAATQDDFQKAFAAAQAADKDAAAHKNQWTSTETALADAKKAAASGNFDDGVKLANEAEALAKAAVAQSVREDADWKQAVIR